MTKEGIIRQIMNILDYAMMIEDGLDVRYEYTGTKVVIILDNWGGLKDSDKIEMLMARVFNKATQ